MKTLILDTSVAIKWIYEEEDSEKAHKILDKIQSQDLRAIVPELFYCEMADFCWGNFQKKLMKFEQAGMFFNRIQAVKVEIRSDAEFADVALENAMHYGVSVYDGLYLSLAEAYLAPLLTADQKLIQACRSKNFDFIESLQEIDLA